MKKLSLILKAVLTLAFASLITSCATNDNVLPTGVSDKGARFHDESSVNAVLRFSSWDYTFLTQPKYIENGYLQQIRRDNIRGVFDKLNVPRGTVVVVVGWTYSGETLNQLVTDWKSILGGCGFQRVVILRAQVNGKLNGSVIVDDSILHVSSAQSASRGG